MKKYELKELTKDDIELKLADAVEELYNLRFQHAMRQLDNPLRLRQVRKDIARFKTILYEYEQGRRVSKKAATNK
ncbi:MAG TPA: 50S ribosomal protein L29 [bacterium]